MRSFTSMLVLGLAAISTALPSANVEKRELVSSETLISDIKGIDDGVKALTADLKAYDGSLASEAPIAGDITAIHLANRKGYTDANLRVTKFNKTETKAIVDYTVQSVGIDIPNSVDVLKSKKPEFESKGMVPIILSGLKLLKYDHDSFSAALLAKTTGSQAEGTAVVKKIDDALQSGIDFYSS
ncbi:hypothetical protein NU219Hw_g808t1 [Hortaea werneckii]